MERADLNEKWQYSYICKIWIDWSQNLSYELQLRNFLYNLYKAV